MSLLGSNLSQLQHSDPVLPLQIAGGPAGPAAQNSPTHLLIIKTTPACTWQHPVNNMMTTMMHRAPHSHTPTVHAFAQPHDVPQPYDATKTCSGLLTHVVPQSRPWLEPQQLYSLPLYPVPDLEVINHPSRHTGICCCCHRHLGNLLN